MEFTGVPTRLELPAADGSSASFIPPHARYLNQERVEDHTARRCHEQIVARAVAGKKSALKLLDRNVTIVCS